MSKYPERVIAETGAPVDFSKGSPAVADNSGSF
jgi:hypothetical protein